MRSSHLAFERRPSTYVAVEGALTVAIHLRKEENMENNVNDFLILFLFFKLTWLLNRYVISSLREECSVSTFNEEEKFKAS